ncbi:MAG: hypothetical protein H6568_01630 [Lewinellaceae bacterium]|nr:hypothetical protein [Saprospiraceae bacterium]MCB9311440.1 hypothetical protein [Lewinellaceae bacterium]HRW74812.1 hypothetical protein [Saprospiraceae bacterium]
MAKFRTNHQQVSGAGKVRMIIWIIAMVAMIVMIWYWMMDVRAASQ